MDRRIFYLLTFFLCLFMVTPTAFALPVKNQIVTIEINDDGSSNWEVTLNYENQTEKSDFFVIAYIKNVEVSGDVNALDCSVNEQGAGTLISCDKISEKSVKYRFTAYNLVRSIGSAKMFSYMFPITGIVGEFDLIINLPLGAGIIEKDKISIPGVKPFSPDTGSEGSDGRKIYVKWFFIKPQLGQSIETSVIYDQIFGPEQIIIGAVLLLLSIPAIFFFFVMRRKGRIEQVLPILNENERVVMKKILETGGEIEQRKIVRECDMSKTKVSRILKELEERGLITMSKRGRSNKVKMAYHHKKKEQHHEHSESEKSYKKFYAEQGEKKEKSFNGDD